MCFREIILNRWTGTAFNLQMKEWYGTHCFKTLLGSPFDGWLSYTHNQAVSLTHEEEQRRIQIVKYT